METRTYNILTHITASKEFWKKVDSVIAITEEKDKDGEIEYIALNKKSIHDGIVSDTAYILMVGKHMPSAELDECFDGYRLDWAMPEMVNYDVIYLWHRKE